MDCGPPGSSVHGGSPGKNTGVDCHAPLKRVGLYNGLHAPHQICIRVLKVICHPVTTDERESNLPNIAESL